MDYVYLIYSYTCKKCGEEIQYIAAQGNGERADAWAKDAGWTMLICSGFDSGWWCPECYEKRQNNDSS